MIDVWVMHLDDGIAVNFISSRAKEWACISEYGSFNLDLPIVFNKRDYAELFGQISQKPWNILDDGGTQQ